MIDRLYYLFEKYPLDFITHGFYLLPVVISIVQWGVKNKAMRSIAVYFFLGFVKECIMLWYSLNRWNNQSLVNVYTIIEVLLIGYIYSNTINERAQQKLIKIITVITAIICILGYQSNEYSSITTTTFRLYLICLVLLFFIWLLSKLNIRNIIKYNMFWFSAGLLLYAAGTFFMFLFSQLLLGVNADSKDFDLYYNVNQALFILFCCFSSIGLWFSKYDKENRV